MDIISRKEAKALGLIYYFTGKPCKRGHFSKRQTVNGGCTECTRENTAKYYADDAKREKKLATSRAWKDANPEKVKEYTKKRWEDPKVRAYQSAFIAANRELYRSYYWVENLSEERLEKMRARKRASPTRNIRATNRRALSIGADGFHCRSDIDLIFEEQGGKCPGCLKTLQKGYHVDHVMPLMLGGSNWPSNLQILCKKCNCRKWAKHPLDWFAQINKAYFS